MPPKSCTPAALCLLTVVLLTVSCGDKLGPDRSPFPFRSTASDYDTITAASLPPGFPSYEARFADSIARAVADGSLRESLSYHHLLQIGRYASVNEQAEEPLIWGLDTARASALNELQSYELTPAEPVIVELARTANLLVITEAHTKPEHRVFTRCLLDDLYAIGYRHLGLENLQTIYQSAGSHPFDSLLQRRGYPVQTILSGIYPSEPEYGNLLRHAIALGFQLFAYEDNGSSDSERDLAQAENIIAYQQAHPGEKIVCHGGWYHAIEDAQPKRPGTEEYWMAYHYKRLTGDDPLTVYQDAMNVKRAPQQSSSPYYAALEKRLSPGGEPLVLRKDGHLWRGPDEPLPFDVVTLTPPLSSTNARRGWAGWDCDGRAYGSLPVGELVSGLPASFRFPLLLEVRGRYDSSIATPVYAVQLEAGSVPESTPLWRGEYAVTVRNRSGEAIRKTVTVTD